MPPAPIWSPLIASPRHRDNDWAVILSEHHERRIPPELSPNDKLAAYSRPISEIVEHEKCVSSRESHGHQELSRFKKVTQLFGPKKRRINARRFPIPTRPRQAQTNAWRSRRPGR